MSTESAPPPHDRSHPATGRRTQPPDLGPEFWERPELVEAVRSGQISEFLAAYRGVSRGWFSQDQLARWIGRDQSTISIWEHGKTPATERSRQQALNAVFCGLKVPRWLITSWGEGNQGVADPSQSVMTGGQP